MGIMKKPGYKKVKKLFNTIWKNVSNMKKNMPHGVSILFISEKNQIILFLRDNKPTIPYPNKWDILGGNVEPGESPEQCVIREMEEEIELELKKEDIHLFKVYHFEDRIEHTYWKELNLNLAKTPLHEGQCLKWFTEKEVQSLPSSDIAFGFKDVIIEFFKNSPHKNKQISYPI